MKERKMLEQDTKGIYPFDFSVLVITYNHEPYLKDALESVLQQEFPYRLQIVIGLDKSPDNTAAVCHQYAQSYPDKIKLIEHADNVGMFENFFRTFQYCEGKYIAILEGDDYWTNKQKLLKQFHYFEKQPNCVLNAGFAQMLNEDKGKITQPRRPFFISGIKYQKDDIILANRFPTLTVALRASSIIWEKFALVKGTPHLDWPLYLSLHYRENDFAYKFNEVFGTYRIHEGGVYSQVSNQKRSANTGKTISYIHKITTESSFQWYLERLLVNLVLNLDEKVTQDIPMFNKELSIYENGHLKKSFLSQASNLGKKYLFGKGNNLFQFKSIISLVHQTKPSYRVYLQFIQYPYITLAVCKYWLVKLTSS